MLSTCQKSALKELNGSKNIFLTGAAGSGKSYLIRHFLKDKDPKIFPTLASTGAAAILVGGRTFHSYFGLGIMEGGVDRTVESAIKNSRVRARVRKAEAIIIDETSMLSGDCLQAAEAIATRARKVDQPWGGLRVIAVGDFAQLPPVSIGTQKKQWAFEDSVWEYSQFQPVLLETIMRTDDQEFLRILNFVRDGNFNQDVAEFLQSRTGEADPDFVGTRLFARKDATERFNLKRLKEISAPLETFATIYTGNERAVATLKRQAPIPESLQIKEGALIMVRQNDPRGRWVNGSLGHVVGINEKEQLEITLLSGRKARLDKSVFTLSDADGNALASAMNYPVNLAWATTIHKAQGSTYDRMLVDLSNLWEPGHAYVALSRVKSSEGLFVGSFTESSFRVDPAVVNFHAKIGMKTTSIDY